MSEALVSMCLTKIHRAIVTGADVNYVGSITIDQKLVELAGLLPGQEVYVNNVDNGEHWRTYVVPGVPGKGEIIMNGPPAHNYQPGDIVIILAYVQVGYADAVLMRHPRAVFVDGNNQMKAIAKEAHWPFEQGAMR